VRARETHQARARGHAGQHVVEVDPILAERTRHDAPAGQPRHRCVGLERRLGDDDLVPRLEQGAAEEREDLIAAVPEQELGRGDAQDLGHRLGQIGRPAVRVEMEPERFLLNRGHGRRRGADGVFVRGQPRDGLAHLGGEAIERRRRHVGLDVVEDRTPARRHRGRSVPCDPAPTAPRSALHATIVGVSGRDGADLSGPAPPPIEVTGVRKSWPTRDAPVVALEDVSLTVRPREFLTLLGPSGCGKSTLLSIIGGLVAPDAGEVRIEGARVAGPDPARIAMAFQDPGLFPWRTALENVEFGLELQGVPAARRCEVARGLLEPVGLRGFESRYPRELSGVMKQRVAIARALDAPILLMDEPFGALDEQTRLLMGEWLLGIWARTRKTVVFVTHRLQEAILLSQRIVVMTARPGRIQASFDVRLPVPRDLDAAPATALRAQLWAAIRDESRRALERGQ